MADDSKTFDLKFRTTAEGEGAKQTKQQIDEVTSATEKATAANAQYRAQMDREAAAAMAANVEAQAQKNALEAQELVIAETRRELVEAIVSGDKEQVALLRQELLIRQSTLVALKEEELSEARITSLFAEEERLLATSAATLRAKAVAAAEVAEGGLLAGINLDKARAEAVTLARELATGSVNGRTLGALLSSLGPSLTIAGLAGYELYEGIKSTAEEINKITKEIDQQSDKLVTNAKAWMEMAKNATSLGDVVKLGDQASGELDAMAAKLKELREHELTGWQKFIDSVTEQVTGAAAMSTKGITPNQEVLDNAIKQQEHLTAAAVETAHRQIEAAKSAQAAWEELEGGPVDKAIDQLTQKLDTLKAAQDSQDTTTADGIKRWASYGKQIELAEKQLEHFQKKLDDTSNADSPFGLIQDAADAEAYQKAADAALKNAQDQLEINQALAAGDTDRAAALKETRDYWAEVTALMEKGVSLIDAETIATQNLDLANQKLGEQAQKKLQSEKDYEARANAVLSAANAQLDIDEALARGDDERATKLKQVKQYWETVTNLMAQGVGLIDAETVATRQLNIENQKLANQPLPQQPKRQTYKDVSGKEIPGTAEGEMSQPAPHTDFGKEFAPHIGEETSAPMQHGTGPSKDFQKSKERADQISSAWQQRALDRARTDPNVVPFDEASEAKPYGSGSVRSGGDHSEKLQQGGEKMQQGGEKMQQGGEKLGTAADKTSTAADKIISVADRLTGAMGTALSKLATVESRLSTVEGRLNAADAGMGAGA